MDVLLVWKIIVNAFLIIIILVATIAIVADYRKHIDDEVISPDDLKQLSRNHFRFSMLIAAWLLYIHVGRFFN